MRLVTNSVPHLILLPGKIATGSMSSAAWLGEKVILNERYWYARVVSSNHRQGICTINRILMSAITVVCELSAHSESNGNLLNISIVKNNQQPTKTEVNCY
ncbi:hypothetical protein BsWGS_17701 [Bradybaena similaris]